MGGGSYGGYLALLIAKIAPWYVDGVIDNSGTVLPLLECIIGKDLSRPEFFFSDLNKLVGMFIKTYWTREDERLSYFFTNENYMIRSLLNSSHLTIQASVNKNIILVSYHSLKDPFNTAKDKQTLFLAYKELGYDATLHLIKDESEIDGRFIKDLNHGMRITDKALFRKELPLMLEKLQKRKSFMQENSISYDDEKDIKAIVFIVGGFGANANISFLDFDREYIAKNFDVVVVHVFYHCFCARQSIDQKYNPKLIPNQDDLERVNGILKNINLGHLSVNKDNFEQIIPLIEQKVNKMKQAGLVDESQKIELSCDFIPPNGDYQNYGIMAAIDHINALKDLVKRFPKFADLPKIYGGGSYGGYLALLIAKIAPWYVDGVIDNSGVCLPFLACILGREMNQGEFYFEGSGYRLYCFVYKYWNRNMNSSYYFGDENYLIRAILNSNHLQIQSNLNKNTIFVSYHSIQDMGAPVQNKIELYKCYQELGYDATLHLIKDENDIDGRFVKSLEHGLRMTDRALFRKELPLMLEKLQGRKSFMQENSISYPCGNKVFVFKDLEDKFELEMIN
nr:DUF2920 family protein [Campylobacter jejuni]